MSKSLSREDRAERKAVRAQGTACRRSERGADDWAVMLRMGTRSETCSVCVSGGGGGVLKRHEHQAEDFGFYPEQRADMVSQHFKKIRAEWSGWAGGRQEWRCAGGRDEEPTVEMQREAGRGGGVFRSRLRAKSRD